MTDAIEYKMKINSAEDYHRLALATARVLRAHLKDLRESYITDEINMNDDIAAMEEALKPFDPLPGDPVNEAASVQEQAR